MVIIQKGVDLAPLTTFRLGGQAEFFCEPLNENELREAFAFARKHHLRIIILGGGSNILFGDGLIRGLVISMRGFKSLWMKDDIVWVGAGMSMDELNAWAIANGKSGLEWSGGLPGTVGGATYMNARAYQHEMSEVVKAVYVMDFDGNKFMLEKENLQYRYKYSIFMDHWDWVITEVGLSFSLGVPDKIKKETEAFRKDREEKGQYVYPSAGCAFKNDYSRNLVAGKVIDEVGLKGLKIGGAEVYHRHANFVVNTGTATAEDVMKLLDEIERVVYEKTGVCLEREVKIIR